ncbi:6-phosphogluconolactonase [Ruania zhangjianzhongii]|uniref:6-phosphogluconolactonase n=1 Tax=Ruania zhangjianzhongii TaxID=2603206 RepID=UPI0011C91ADA|nr:6-phosphogluconolactonase [Ruania zhangjianzhongii]
MTGSSGERAVVVHPDADTLARAAAARFLLALADAQSLRHPVHVAITGGTIGTQVLAEIGHSDLLGVVDFSGVHIWWIDERFVPGGDPDRNEGQAGEALLARLPIPDENVHRMPSSDEAKDVDAAARAYAEELAAFAPEGAVTPDLDLVLLGMGPDGHIASLFPGHGTVAVTDRTVIGVPDSPKPPPERISLTLPVLNSARQVWIIVSGAAKADQVSRALEGAEPDELPVAAAAGRDLTLWLVDAEAAGQ